MIYEKCKDILLKETELIKTAAALQEKIRLAVMDREWEGFEDNINEINAIEIKLTALEDEREKLFSEFDPTPHDPKGLFYSIACKLPEEQRNDLTEIYRSLKMETLKLRIANESYMTYLSGINTTIKDFFDVTFPERKTYTPRGTHHSHDMRSIVLNQSF